MSVWAVDLWIRPTENWRRMEATGVQNCVLPLHAEAAGFPGETLTVSPRALRYGIVTVA